MSGTPMKVMLKDMFEFLDSIATIQDINHDESLEKLQKKSNNNFLQFNMVLLLAVMESELCASQAGSCPCNECHEELKEENEKLKEEIHKRGHCEEVVEAYEKGIMKRNKEIFELKKEIEKLKERQSIMSAMADSHIQDINEVHKDYGDMVRKLKEDNGMSKLVHHQNMGLLEDLKKLKEENEKLEQKIDEAGCSSIEELIQQNEWGKSATLKWNETRDELKATRHHTNMLLDLIKTAETPEQIAKLKDMPRFDE